MAKRGQQVAILWGRDNKKEQLEVIRTFHSYKMALEEGQRRFGHGNFMVETDFPPSREDQLNMERIEDGSYR